MVLARPINQSGHDTAHRNIALILCILKLENVTLKPTQPQYQLQFNVIVNFDLICFFFMSSVDLSATFWSSNNIGKRSPRVLNSHFIHFLKLNQKRIPL